MAGKVVSIEIGQQVIKICEIEYKKKNPHVYRCISFETPMEFVNDGYICNHEALAKELREQMKEAGIKNDKVVFTIASTKIANREVLIPDVKENRIRDILMANANDYFPIDIEEYNIAHVVLEKIEAAEEKQIRLLVLAAPGDMIKGYYELADLMKVSIESIDYIGNSAYQMIRYLGYTGVNLAVQMNEQSTIISLVENDCLLLQRTLPYGTNMLAQAIINNPIFEVRTTKQAIELANKEAILKAQFVDFKSEYRTFTEESEEQSYQIEQEIAKEEVTNSLRILVSNINRVIDYFTTKYQGKRIEKIIVAGDGAYIKNLDNLVANEIGITTEVLQELSNVTFVKDAADKKGFQNHYISCIGAAMAPVDFKPKELGKREHVVSTLRLPLLMLMVCALGSITIVLSSVITYRMAKKECNELEQKISAIEEISTIYEEYKSSEEMLKALTDMDLNTKNVSENILPLLDELEVKTPMGCFLRALDYKDNTLSLLVAAEDKSLCAKYVEVIKTLEHVDVVTTNGYSAEDSKEKNGSVLFTVVITLK